MPIEPAALVARHWVHSHEEDSAGVAVYRPKGYAFPPARGRKELELSPSGELTEHGYGPTDRRTKGGRGSWRLDGEELVLKSEDGPERRLRVASLTADRLTLAKA